MSCFSTIPLSCEISPNLWIGYENLKLVSGFSCTRSKFHLYVSVWSLATFERAVFRETIGLISINFSTPLAVSNLFTPLPLKCVRA